MKIAYIFNKGRLTRLPDIASGAAPHEFFYGAVELEKKDHEIGFFEIDVNFPPRFFAGLVNIAAAYGFIPEKLTGGALVETRELVSALNGYDVIVGTTSGIGYALALWKLLGKLRVPIVTIHCGLLNNPYRPLRRKLSEYLLAQMQTVLFGESELQPMIELFHGQERRTEINQFGVDHRFWIPSTIDCSHRYVLSVGNDGRRDFDTLIRAATKIPVEVKILTSRKLPEQLPDNITLVKSSWNRRIVSDVDLRTLYQNATCVIVTLCDSYQPSGQSVALQAMACGTPVIITNTKGFWAKNIFDDTEKIVFTTPGDADELAEKAIRLLIDDELRNRLRINGRALVEKFFNSEQFAENMERICTAVASSAGNR